jgi:hypothetical protein
MSLMTGTRDDVSHRPHIDLLPLIVEVGATVDSLKFRQQKLRLFERWPITLTRPAQAIAKHDILRSTWYPIFGGRKGNSLSYEIADSSERFTILPIVCDEFILDAFVA